jgi:hypothetical protein
MTLMPAAGTWPLEPLSVTKHALSGASSTSSRVPYTLPSDQLR